MRSIYLAIFLSLLFSCHYNQGNTSVADVEVVTDNYVVELCRLLENPVEFNGKEVQTSGILLGGFESAFLYAPECMSDEKLIWFQIKDGPINQKLEAYFAPESPEYQSTGLTRVRGSFSGTFQTKRRKDATGFGHMSGSNHQLVITDATDLKPVDKDVPYPWN